MNLPASTWDSPGETGLALNIMTIVTPQLSFHLEAEDQEIVDLRAISIGAHLVTPRSGYTHHGIYVGEGRVVHYAGLSRSLHIGPVEEVSIKGFIHGRPLRLRLRRGGAFGASEIAARALSRLGENRYDVLKNNCEHFCEWCIRGASVSPQVDRWLALPRQLAAVVHEGFGRRPLVYPANVY